jgi:hypothetical protein
MPMPPRRFVAISLLCLAASLIAINPALAAETVLVDGVPHVRNTAEPREGVRHVELEELWRGGGDSDDIFFGLVTRVRQDEHRNLYVMDAQLSQVHVYDEQGAHLRTLFGEGEGPGEIRGPRDLVLMPDGRVGAVQEMPGKLIFVDRENRPAGVLRIGGSGVEHGGFCQTFAAHAGADILLVAGFLQAPGAEPGHIDQTSFLTRFDQEGHEVVRFVSDTHDIDIANFTFEEQKHLATYWWNADVGADDRVYVAPYLDRYAIQVFGADGTLQRVIEREYAPWRRTDAEKERFTEVIKAIYAGSPIEIGVEVSDDEPVILYFQRGLRVHADGTIWVLTNRSVREQEPGVMATFDVFDAEGAFVRQVAVHHQADGQRDGVFFVGDDRAVVITGYKDAMLVQFTGGRLSIEAGDDESGAMEVIYCRVKE